MGFPGFPALCLYFKMNALCMVQAFVKYLQDFLDILTTYVRKSLTSKQGENYFRNPNAIS